jgi:hypothetical protein
VSAQEAKATNQKRYSYPSYLDLLTEEQFKAFEKGVRLAREQKTQEALAYFNEILPMYLNQPYMLTAICIILADIGNVTQAKEVMWQYYDKYKNNGMYLCGLLRLDLADGNFEKFEEIFGHVKQWLKEHEQQPGQPERTQAERIEHAVVFAEAAYLGVRYCIAQNILGQAAYLIKTYEEIMPDHDMHVALKFYLAQALQGVIPNFRLPPHEHEFEPFMNNVIAQIIEQNKEQQQKQAQQ